MTAGPEEPNAFVEVERTLVRRDRRRDDGGARGRARCGAASRRGAAPRSVGGPLDRRPAPARARRDAGRRRRSVGSGGSASPRRDRGDRVMLVDERHRIDHPPDGVTVLPRTTALGVYDDGYVVAHERSATLERLWHVRAARVVLATGATRALRRVRRERQTRRDARVRGGGLRRAVRRASRRPRGRSSTTNESGLAVGGRTPGSGRRHRTHDLGVGEDLSRRERRRPAPRLRRVEPEPDPVAVGGWRAPL